MIRIVMLKAIIFDAFGTLISTGSGSLDATTALLARIGRFDVAPEKFYKRWKEYHTEYIFSSHAFVCEDTAFRVALKRLYSEYGIRGDAYKDADVLIDTFDKRELFPEVKQALDILSCKYTLCIGSNTDNLPLETNMKRNGLFVERVYTSQSLGVYKPRKEFFKAILTDLNILPDEMLFVGDSLRDDIYGPSQLGIRTCHVNRKGIEYTDIFPDISVNSLDELLRILENY